AWHASAAEPELLWSYEAQSNLYPSPLVADVHPNPGLESIISDSEVREMLCVDAKGSLLWRYSGGWTRRLTSGASLSFAARDGAGTLLIGNSDGKLCCIDAATGQELWTRTVGPIEWGTAIWADLDGDDVDEAIAGTQNAIVALTATGDPLWTRDAFEDKPVNISGPIAAADLDGDGHVEIIALDQSGPFCVSYDGEVRWRRITGDQFQGAPVVTRLVNDGPATILALSGDSDFVYCFDALNGEPVWKCGILGLPDAYAAGGLAAGDIDGNGSTEIIAPDNSGHVHCIDHTGTLRWVFATDKATHSAASIGDVDGDGEIEILLASGDHHLYCVNTHGRLEWKYQAG
ncbi:MAG: PQQ-binding-like beta-propeller repeat protein, partial [Phycisphaerales bacterium]|nr:PQQ-binding-like beta-propeller repeat protein [Phycisphaerales bacterium]